MANGLYELYRQKMLSPAPGLFVTAISGSPGATLTITTSLPHHLKSGVSQIALANIGGITGASGIFTVVDADPLTVNTATVFNSVKFTISGTFTGTYTSGGDVTLPDATLKTSGHVIRWGQGSSGSLYGDDIKVMAVNTVGGTTYTPNLLTDEYASIIPNSITAPAPVSAPSGAILLNSSNLVSKTDYSTTGPFVGGIADAGDVVFTLAGPNGTTVEAVVIYKDTGNISTSPLMLYLDNATGLPITLNGGDVTLVWDSTANRIYSI